jgi:hypothetical protein
MAGRSEATVPDVALYPLNEAWKFFLAHLPFSGQPKEIREHFNVSSSLCFGYKKLLNSAFFNSYLVRSTEF